MKPLLLLFLPLFISSCAAHRVAGSFRVLPASPNYLLRSPDSRDTPFPEVLDRFNGFVPGKDWLDLRPEMELRVENAYYKEGMPKHGLNGFLGTRIARYQVSANGRLRLSSAESGLKQLPVGQPSVRQLLPALQRRYSQHRFFFAVVFSKRAETRGSVLLGADSADELERITARLLSDPDAVCGGASTHCAVFPEACTVSLEMNIVVNGARRKIAWGSLLASIAARPRHVELLRLYNGRLTPVDLNPGDEAALRLPLLPGDRVTWD